MPTRTLEQIRSAYEWWENRADKHEWAWFYAGKRLPFPEGFDNGCSVNGCYYTREEAEANFPGKGHLYRLDPITEWTPV